jgi:uncharacterized protein (DUF2235 family)
MKKEIIAVVVLALMIAASIYNYHHLEDIKDDVIALAERSFEQAETGNWDEARRLGEEAAQLWSSYDAYTHIFLRHSEIVDAVGALYDYLLQVYDENLNTAKAALDAARARFEHLVEIEKLRPGSIF